MFFVFLISANIVVFKNSNECSDLNLKTLMSVAFAQTEAEKNCEDAGGTYNQDEITIPIPGDDDLILCKFDLRDCCVENEI